MCDALEAQAASFILAREEAEWDHSKEQALNDWLSQSARHRAVYWRLEHGWNRVDPIRALVDAPTARKTPSNALRNLLLLAAASIPPLLAGWSLSRNQPETWDAVYQTEIGDRKIVSLTDGTELNINTDSRISVSYSPTHRTIIVDKGEVYFKIAQDPIRPFLVKAGDSRIRDIGTEFLVRKSGADVLTAVKQGIVGISFGDVNGSRDAAFLSAGDRAVSRGRRTLTIAHDMKFVDAALGWREGRLNLSGMRLADVAAEFNRYNRRKLLIDGDELGGLQVGGSFSIDNVEGFARLLHASYGLKVSQSESAIHISR